MRDVVPDGHEHDKWINWTDRYGHPSLLRQADGSTAGAYFAGWVVHREEGLQVLDVSGRYPARRDRLSFYQETFLELATAVKFIEGGHAQSVTFYQERFSGNLGDFIFVLTRVRSLTCTDARVRMRSSSSPHSLARFLARDIFLGNRDELQSSSYFDSFTYPLDFLLKFKESCDRGDLEQTNKLIFAAICSRQLNGFIEHIAFGSLRRKEVELCQTLAQQLLLGGGLRVGD